MVLSTILKFYIFSALCTELMIILRRQKFLRIWFPLMTIVILAHFQIEYLMWDDRTNTPHWLFLVNDLSTSLLIPLTYIFFCNECQLKKNNVFTYTMFAMGAISFLPSLNICLDVKTIGQSAPLLRGIQIFYGGKRAAFWESYTPALICQGYMLVMSLWTLRKKMSKKEWKMSDNGKQLFYIVCAIVVLGIIMTIPPNNIWQYEAMKYFYFSSFAILLVVANTMLGLGFSLAPIVDEDDIPVFIETEPSMGRALKELERLMEVEKIYLNPNLTIEDLSKRLYTNRSYVTRVLRERYGKTFVDVLRDKRIAYAKEYMQEHREKLDVIATETGFNSAATFCKTFKMVTGETPVAWAKHSALAGIYEDSDDHLTIGGEQLTVSVTG